MFDFGKQMKNLRKAKGLTQEQVAELLNVSKQSVSRWENNMTYPDIAFLPTIASFYCVTVDSLLGVDRETNEKAIMQYFTERQKAHQVGDVQTAFELSQKLYTRFPNDTSVIGALMTDSYLMGFHNVNDKRKHYLEMSIFVSERFMKMTEDIEESCRCIRNIAICHKLLGNQEMAVSWMKKLPSMWSGIEQTALSVLEGEDRVDSIQCSLDAVLHLLYKLIYTSSEAPNLTVSQHIAILEKVPALFELLFENGDYGFYHAFLCDTNLELAKCYLPDKEKALMCINKAIVHARKVDNALPSKHTSVLFADQAILPEEWTSSWKSEREKLIYALEGVEFAAMRNDEEFTAIVQVLKEEVNRP